MNNIMNKTLRVKEKRDRKINLFSGHDINVSAMLKALKIFDNRLPAFTSGVIIELRERNGDYFVKVSIFSFTWLSTRN